MTRHVIISAVLTGLLLATSASADTIRLKSGSTLRGKVLRFDGKEFTIIIEGTQSRAMVNSSDVLSIDFDESTGTTGSRDSSSITKEEVQATEPPKGPTESPRSSSGESTPPTGAPSRTPPRLARVREFTVEVPSKEVWADSGIDLKIGQKVRISASGRVTIASGRTSGPEGTQSEDPGRLIPDRPTGGLIGVIGDDNDEFFFIGAAKEFVAERQGRLFLMVNESNLDDNGGTFTVRLQVEINEPESSRP